MDAQTQRKLFKVVVVGGKGSGKTSLVKRYTSGVFHQKYKPTKGVDFKVKELDDGSQIQFWDVAGEIHKGTSDYYEGVNGFIFVGDCMDLSSRDSISRWIKDIEKHLGDKPVACVFIINKMDLVIEEIKAVDYLPFTSTISIDGYGGGFVLSVKNGKGIDEAMNHLVKQMKEKSSFSLKKIPAITGKRTVCVVGDSRVGKTSLIKRHSENYFPINYKATAGMEKSSVEVEKDGKLVEVNFIDVGGQELRGNMTKHYYQGATAFLVVADYTNEQSLKNIRRWIDDFQDHGPAVPFTILINKTDEKCPYICTQTLLSVSTTLSQLHSDFEMIFVSAKDDNRAEEIRNVINSLL